MKSNQPDEHLNQTSGTEGSFAWHVDPPGSQWDKALAMLGGHPLQSSLWGEARKQVDGIADQRWLLKRDEEPVLMIRIERRPLPLVGWIGWSPRGPTGADLSLNDGRVAELIVRLRADRMKLLITDRWERWQGPVAQRRPKTIWIDLRGGENQVWERFESVFRRNLRRAGKVNVVIEDTGDPAAIERFYALCRQVSLKKEFSLATSTDLMNALLQRGNADVEARLFLAYIGCEIAAGIFVLKCGRSVHYFWGGASRATSSARAGEAVHWAAIKWAISRGCSLYDLEGIDPQRNPGTYAFKKKMGGDEVTLAGKQYFPLGSLGGLLARVDRWRG